MSKQLSNTPESTTDRDGGGTPVERLMAISRVERAFVADRPRLRREIRFQATALLLCPLSLGFAVYRVALSLLDYAPVAAALLGAVAAFSLFTLDQHYLVQARGNAADDVRRSMYKVRFISIAIMALSYALMSTDTFKTDIERVVAEHRQALREELEASPRFQAELDAARAAVDQAAKAAARAEALRDRIAQLQAERSRALEELTNQVQGNTTGTKKRVSGDGPLARGQRAAAERLAADIDAAKNEQARLGDVAERLAAAKRQLAAVDQRIDEQTDVAFGGRTQRLEAMAIVLQNSLSAWVTVVFWLLIGTLPDLLMLSAARQMFNHAPFAALREAEEEDLQAQIAQARRALRQRHTDRLTPIEVHLVAAPQPGVGAHAEDAHPRTPPKAATGERT